MLPEKDIRIMCELRKNARTSLVSISRKTAIPVSTIYDRIRARQKDVIKKHTSILDFPKLGFNIRTKMLLKIKDTENFERFVFENANVNSVFRLNSDFNFMIDCIFRYMAEMQDFTGQLNRFGIEKKQIHFVSDEILRENFLNEVDKNEI